MPKVAKPKKEAGGWSLRRRIKGEDFYVCGCETQAEARAEMDKKLKAVSGRQKPWGLGPEQTTVGQSLLDYGLQTLPFLKGARQECNRINRYLRAAGLPTLRVVPLDERASDAQTEAATRSEQPKGIRRQNKAGQVYWKVVTTPPTTDRKIPKRLGGHRRQLAKKSEGSDLLRERLARRDVESTCRFPWMGAADIQADLDGACLKLREPKKGKIEQFARLTRTTGNGLLAAHCAAQSIPLIRELSLTDARAGCGRCSGRVPFH